MVWCVFIGHSSLLKIAPFNRVHIKFSLAFYSHYNPILHFFLSYSKILVESCRF